jgi:hypothetical protein
MAYTDIAELQADPDFIQRTIACYAVETLGQGAQMPAAWQAENSWDMAAQPGFGDAYAYAKNTGVENPGKNPAVITDGQILAAVQSLITQEGAPA